MTTPIAKRFANAPACAVRLSSIFSGIIIATEIAIRIRIQRGGDFVQLALVKFLTSHDAQLKYASAATAIPARQTPLAQLRFEPAALTETVKQSRYSFT